MYALTGLDGKVAVVSGAGRMRSIGRSIATELARAGCDVALIGTGRPANLYPDDEKVAGWRDIESVADEIRGLGGEALPIVGDVSSFESVVAMSQQVHDRFGRIDIVINNAGASRGADRRPVIDLDPSLWERVIAVNLFGSFLMSKVFGRHIIDGGRGGSIINISSIAGKRMSPASSAYAASKAGLHALTACMAREVAEHRVRVNAICPGLIDTSRMDDIGRDEAWEKMLELVPLGRAGTGSDVAGTAVYLCSDQGAWVTGQAWNVDGGQVVEH